MARIAAAILAYNAESKLPELLKSLKGHVDVLVIGIDAKTTDSTKAIAEKAGAVVYDAPDVLTLNGGFAEARNTLFSHIPADVEWVMWIDTDDVFCADRNLHDVVAEIPANLSGIALPYAYFRDEYGNLTTIFDRERVIRMACEPFWVGPLHETCQVKKGGEWGRPYGDPKDAPCWVEHKNRKEESEKGTRNFSLLWKWLEQEPENSRVHWYLGMQYFAGLDYEKAAQRFLLAVEKKPGINLEAWQALVFAGKAFKNLNQNEKAIECANRAMMMYPDLADSYHDMAQAYQALRSFDRAIWWHEQGITKSRPSGPVMTNPLDYDYNPYCIIHTSYAALGRLDEAAGKLAKALAIRPKDPDLRRAGAGYQRLVGRASAIKGGLTLASHLYETSEVEKARTVLDCLPAGTREAVADVGNAMNAVEQRLFTLHDDNVYENAYFVDQEKDDKSNPRLDWIVNRLQGAKKVLWVGAGNSAGPFALAERGVKVVVVDINSRKVKQGNFSAVKRGFLKKRYVKDQGKSLPVLMKKGEHDPDLPVQFWYGWGERLPKAALALAPYDAVVCGSLLGRVRDPDALITSLESLNCPIIHTLPDGAFPMPVERDSGVMRLWSRVELENRYLTRGRIVDAHTLREAQDTIGFAYEPDKNWWGAEHPSVTIYCGPGWEDWNPDQIDAQGLGGSETAVVLLAKEFVAKGLRVMVYGPSEGTWDGVHYRHWSKFNPQARQWMFVSWRNPAMFDTPIDAEVKVLWVHDTDYRDLVTEKRMAEVDHVWVMSEWHRKHWSDLYPFSADKTLVVGNGLDPERFTGNIERDPNRIIYSSSPDRGLEQLAGYWPKIREALPDAQLDIYYDWVNFDLMGGPADYKAKVMALCRQDGINWRGRVGQRALAQSLMGASALLYPGPHDFCETFGITFLEAQAAGCVPVTRDNGALPETNRYGIVLPNDSSVDEWVTALQDALSRPEAERTKMRLWAASQTWAEVANRIIAGAVAGQKALPASVETAEDIGD